MTCTEPPQRQWTEAREIHFILKLWGPSATLLLAASSITSIITWKCQAPNSQSPSRRGRHAFLVFLAIDSESEAQLGRLPLILFSPVSIHQSVNWTQWTIATLWLGLPDLLYSMFQRVGRDRLWRCRFIFPVGIVLTDRYEDTST